LMLLLPPLLLLLLLYLTSAAPAHSAGCSGRPVTAAVR